MIVLSARVAHEINGDLGMKWKKTFIDCKRLCSPEFSKIIVQLYYHTGADAVSAFFGHGKKSIMKNALKFLISSGNIELAISTVFGPNLPKIGTSGCPKTGFYIILQ